MTDNHLTSEQAKALASFLVALRPDWNIQDVATVLYNGRDRAPIRDQACAAISAATDSTDDGTPVVGRPSVIDQPGQHWRHRGDDIRPDFDRPDDNRRCAVCYRGYNDCRRVWRGNHEFVSLTDYRRAARESDSEGHAAAARQLLDEARYDAQEATDAQADT